MKKEHSLSGKMLPQKKKCDPAAKSVRQRSCKKDDDFLAVGDVGRGSFDDGACQGETETFCAVAEGAQSKKMSRFMKKCCQKKEENIGEGAAEK